MGGQAELFEQRGETSPRGEAKPLENAAGPSARVALERFTCPHCSGPVAGRRRRLLRCRWCSCRFRVVSIPEVKN